MNQNRLFVCNLSFQSTEIDLRYHFGQVGAIKSANLMIDKVTGRSRGFGFVEYEDAENATKAIEQFHEKEFQGRALTVNIARPREDRVTR